MENRVTFSEALEIATQHGGVKHLLLGNGFSMAKDQRFSYGAIFSREGSIPAGLEDLFALYQKNAEQVIFSLESSLEYEDIKRVKSAFAETFINEIHPENRYCITEEERTLCEAFFSNFSKVYTTNYDLLSYWINVGLPKGKRFKDGFRKDNTKGYDEPLVCKYGSSAKHACFFYLHGGLHLFEYFRLIEKFPKKLWSVPVYMPSEYLHKISYDEKKGTLLKQVQKHFSENHLPLIVMEGNSENKKRRIELTPYLKIAFQNFKHLTQNLYGIKGRNLFIFGHSLSEQDQHILDAIRESHTDNIFCSFLNPNDSVINRVKALESEETQVYLFQCDTAHVWNNPSVIESSKKNNQSLVLMS